MHIRGTLLTVLQAVNSTDMKAIAVVLGLLAAAAVADATFPYCRCTDYKCSSNPVLMNLLNVETTADSTTLNLKGSSRTSPANPSTCFSQIIKHGVQKIQFDTSAVCKGHVSCTLNGLSIPCGVVKAANVDGYYIKIRFREPLPVVAVAAATVSIKGTGPCADAKTLTNGVSDAPVTVRYSVFNWKDRIPRSERNDIDTNCCPSCPTTPQTPLAPVDNPPPPPRRPTEPAAPGNPLAPGFPQIPPSPGAPGTPPSPGAPGTPPSPGAPGTPPSPGAPGTPPSPGAPGTPPSPGAPGTPPSPRAPRAPRPPKSPGSPGAPPTPDAPPPPEFPHPCYPGSQIKNGKRVGIAGTKYSIFIKSYNAMTKEMCLAAKINPTCDPKLSPSRNACCEAELNKIEVHANGDCNRAVAQFFKLSTQPDAKLSVAWDRNKGKGLTFKFPKLEWTDADITGGATVCFTIQSPCGTPETLLINGVFSYATFNTNHKCCGTEANPLRL